MSNVPSRFEPPASQEIVFQGDHLVAVVIEGNGVAVPLHMMCEALGIVPSAQFAQLHAHPVYAAGLRIVNAVVGGSVRAWIERKAAVARWERGTRGLTVDLLSSSPTASGCAATSCSLMSTSRRL